MNEAVSSQLRRYLLQLSALPSVRASYLIGSQSYGGATAASDLDVAVIVDDKQSKAAVVAALEGMPRQPSDVKLDIFAVGLDELPPPRAGKPQELADYRETVLTVKYSGLHIYGDDVKNRIPEPTPGQYAMLTAEVPWMFIRRYRQVSELDPHDPLQYPNPTAEFYGYVGPGSFAPNTCKPVLSLYTWSAMTALGYLEGEVHWNKRRIVASYGEHQMWKAADLRVALDKIVDEWLFQVPEDPADRLLLRKICADALTWERHFQQSYLGAGFETWRGDRGIEVTQHDASRQTSRGPADQSR